MIPEHLRPKTWPLWIVLGLLRLMLLLPWSVLMKIGPKMADLVYRFIPQKRRIILTTNLKLCFPELSDSEREQLAQQHIHAMGKGVIDLGLAWWASRRKLEPLAHFQGLEHLQKAMDEGKGVILLSAHFTSVEMSGRLISHHFPIDTVYRPSEKPFTEHLLHVNREHHSASTIHKSNVRGMIRSLRQGHAIWYAPDQNMGTDKPLFVPFFGVETATNTATSSLARITGAAVIPFLCLRRRDGKGYDLELSPPLDKFPSGDLRQDAIRINEIFETWIRRQPEDYFWLHRRFKQRPKGEKPFYEEKG
ncbi:MAG: LpxL/LpxP family Kdo(2)-lipid IV(A) lauroyl/palmitoleoyl acyltransferase [Gammaproteobacteria bacterium]|nr:LpxL/LpxP family Kdo(2)-lipid IV(A) lauroyl/palmitoleoyl acyltransferase [Gammaproteobacteria bacterium]